MYVLFAIFPSSHLNFQGDVSGIRAQDRHPCPRLLPKFIQLQAQASWHELMPNEGQNNTFEAAPLPLI